MANTDLLETQLRNCYLSLGGDLSDVMTRLPSLALVKKFVLRFPADASYAELESALERGCRGDAFRAAHTLKGVCANLGFTALLRSSSAVTELLRQEEDSLPAGLAAPMAQLRQDYQQTLSTIRSLTVE